MFTLSVLVYEKDYCTAAQLCIASSLCVKGVMLDTCSAHCTHIDNIISTRHHSAGRERERAGVREKPRAEEKKEEEKEAL